MKNEMYKKYFKENTNESLINKAHENWLTYDKKSKEIAYDSAIKVYKNDIIRYQKSTGDDDYYKKQGIDLLARSKKNLEDLQKSSPESSKLPYSFAPSNAVFYIQIAWIPLIKNKLKDFKSKASILRALKNPDSIIPIDRKSFGVGYSNKGERKNRTLKIGYDLYSREEVDNWIASLLEE